MLNRHKPAVSRVDVKLGHPRKDHKEWVHWFALCEKSKFANVCYQLYYEVSLSSFVPLLDYEVATSICLVLNVIISLFFPLNFAIYCGMSQHFRDTFASLFFRKNVKNKVLDSVSR